MEEGRRMFQIFAARMFEQRVLQAYREKVARERQAKLMEEEEEERRKEEARKEKKAKEALKKKEKAAQKKEKAAEEKARKDAEKAAEEEARRQAEAEKVEEARRKAEEKRKKREAQKKAEDDERAKKEAEKQRQKQLQAEQERRAREAKDREKKAREERQQKEKDAREQKEREARELKEKQEAEKRQKESQVEGSKAPKAESKPGQKQKQQEERAAKKAAALAATPATMTLPKRPAQHATNPALPVLPQQPPATTFASPKPSIATPALPKAPTPIRPRQASQQDGGPSAPSPAPLSENVSSSQSPIGSTPAPTSPGLSGPPSHRGSIASHHSANPSQTMSPLQPGMARFSSATQPPQLSIPPAGMNYPPGLQPGPPGFANIGFAPAPGGYRQPPPGMGPPGLTSPLMNRGFPAPPPPGYPQPIPDAMGPFGAHSSKDATQSSHSRQHSGGFESPITGAQAIARPTPIGRPASVVQGQRPSDSPVGSMPKVEDDMESRINRLGSSALLENSEDVIQPLPGFGSSARRGYPAPGRAPVFPPFGFGEPGIMHPSQNIWGANAVQPSVMAPFVPSQPGPPPGFGGPGSWVAASPGQGFSVPGGIGIGRPAPPRVVTQPNSVVRQRLCNVCRELAMHQDPAKEGFIPLALVRDTLKDQVGEYNPLGKGPLAEEDILVLCETEGDMANGGGNFDMSEDGGERNIRWNPDKMNQGPRTQSLGGGFGAPGQLGSPNSSFGGQR